MVLICISPLSDDGGHLSMCLFDIRIFSLIQCLFKIFPILEDTDTKQASPWGPEVRPGLKGGSNTDTDCRLTKGTADDLNS